MPATQPLHHLFNLKSRSLNKGEAILLETELLRLFYEKLFSLFQLHLKPYCRIMKYDKDKEQKMIDENIMRLIINDIVTSNEYNLKGIACYTETPEDIIYEIASGSNKAPSLQISQKIISLHRTVRPKLYDQLMKQVIHEHLTSDSAEI